MKMTEEQIRDLLVSEERRAPLAADAAWESATASAPAGKRSLPVPSLTARHTASATSISLVVRAGRANA